MACGVDVSKVVVIVVVVVVFVFNGYPSFKVSQSSNWFFFDVNVACHNCELCMQLLTVFPTKHC